MTRSTPGDADDNGGGFLLEDGIQRLDGGLVPERRASCDELIQKCAEREDVRGGTDRIAADLLGRHVSNRAHGDPGRRRDLRGRCDKSDRADGCVELGQTEVEELDATVVQKKYVLGFEIAMDDAASVCGGEAMRDLCDPVEGVRKGNGPGAQPIAQRLAVEQLRDEVRPAVGCPDVIKRQQIRMIECAGRACLLLESPQPVRIGREPGRQHFDRDIAADPRIRAL